jgi:hypothetical protein
MNCAKISVEQDHAIFDLIECGVQLLQFLVAANNVGDVGVGQKPPAVRQDDTAGAGDLAISEAHFDGRRIAGDDGLNTLRNECVQVSAIRRDPRSADHIGKCLF